MSVFPAAIAGVYIAIIIVISLGLQVGLSFIGASMAKKKGYSFGGFWCLGFFSSFLIGIIMAAVLPDLNMYVRKDEFYRRPPMPPQGIPAGRPCPNCGKPLPEGNAFCPSCGARVQ